MHRQQLLKLLESYQPTNLQEQQYKQRTINFVNQQENCFKRSLEIGHITGSGWLLNKDETKALLMHHTKLNMWVQLGGHCDGDSDVFTVTTKECQEESGINHIEPISANIFDIDIHTIPARPDEPEHDHYDIRFLLKVKNDEDVVQNRESKELRWISKNPSELPTQERSVTRMFEKWVNLNNK